MSSPGVCQPEDTCQGSTAGTGQSQASVPPASSRAPGFPLIPGTHTPQVEIHQEEGLSAPAGSQYQGLGE